MLGDGIQRDVWYVCGSIGGWDWWVFVWKERMFR